MRYWKSIGVSIFAFFLCGQSVQVTRAGGGGGSVSAADALQAAFNQPLQECNIISSASAYVCNYAQIPAGSGGSNGTDADRVWITWANIAALNEIDGWTQAGPSNPVCQFRHRPRAEIIVESGSDVTQVRYYVAISENDINSHVVAGGASGIAYAGLIYQAAASANWHCCSGDGGNYSCTDTGLAVAASTDYRIVITVGADDVTCTINGTDYTHASNTPTDATGAGVMVRIANDAAVARSIKTSRFVFGPTLAP